SPRTQSPFGCNIVTFVTPLTSASSVHFSHYDIDAAENYHHIGHGMAETEILENGQVNEAWRAPHVATWVVSSIADQIEAKLAFGRFDAPVGFAHRWTKGADLHFRIHDRPGGKLLDS